MTRLSSCLALLLLLLGASACQLIGGVGGAAEPALAEEAEDSADIVLAALAEGDDELARATLLRMRAFHPDAGTQAWIDNVMEVLEGRRLLAALDLELAVLVDESGAARVRRLVLRARSDQDQVIVMRMAPPALRVERDWLDGLGNGGHTSDSAALDGFQELEVPARGVVEIPLLELEGARGTAAAVRERWDLETHFCYLEQGGREYPVNAPSVRGVERYLLASHLQLGALDAGPLIESLRGEEMPALPVLVERAVRIPRAEMSAALDALTPVVETLPLARVGRAAGVLTWIAESSDEEYFSPGSLLSLAVSGDEPQRLTEGGRMLAPRHLHGDARAWKAWLQVRGRLHALKLESSLDLPGVVGHSLRP